MNRLYDAGLIEAAEVARFDISAERDADNHAWVRVDDSDEYIFWPGANGIAMLHDVAVKTDGKFKLLDIGYGNGAFLKDAKTQYPESMTVGIACEIDGEDRSIDTIITGDFARPNTYISHRGNTEDMTGIDVAVSHLGFMHLPNSHKALTQLGEILKPEAQAYLDHVTFWASSDEALKTADRVGEWMRGFSRMQDITLSKYGNFTLIGIDGVCIQKPELIRNTVPGITPYVMSESATVVYFEPREQ